MKTHKTFDAQEITLRIQETIAAETDGMTSQERWNRQRRVIQAGAFADRWYGPCAEASTTDAEEQGPDSRKRKDFDCVEMKHRIQERIAEETKDLTADERMARLRQLTEEGPFSEKWKEEPNR